MLLNSDCTLSLSIGTVGLHENFPCIGCVQDSGNSVVYFAEAPPTLVTSGMCHDSRVCYPDIYGFAIDSVEIRCI